MAYTAVHDDQKTAFAKRPSAYFQSAVLGGGNLAGSAPDEIAAFGRQAVQDHDAPKILLELAALYPSMGSPSGRLERFATFSRYPDIAIPLLISKARSDHDVERLAEVAELLSSVKSALRSVFDYFAEYGENWNPCFIECVLRAIRWSSFTRSASANQQLVTMISRWMTATDPDVRQAVAETLAVLPADHALSMLGSMQSSESDSDVLDAIDEAIQYFHR
jgi:hypothetical protein